MQGSSRVSLQVLSSSLSCSSLKVSSHWSRCRERSKVCWERSSQPDGGSSPFPHYLRTLNWSWTMADDMDPRSLSVIFWRSPTRQQCRKMLRCRLLLLCWSITCKSVQLEALSWKEWGTSWKHRSLELDYDSPRTDRVWDHGILIAACTCIDLPEGRGTESPSRTWGGRHAWIRRSSWRYGSLPCPLALWRRRERESLLHSCPICILSSLLCSKKWSCVPLIL